MWKRVGVKIRRIGFFLGMILFTTMCMPLLVTQAATVKVTTIKVNNVTNKKLIISEGKSYQLKTTVSPSNATNKNVSYASSNKKIVTVTNTGKLKAKKKGTAYITIKAKDRSKKSTKIKVQVKSKKTTIQTISLQTKEKQKLLTGETYQLITSIKPVSLKKNGVTYTSSNKKVVKVTATGKVTAVGPGSAKITVKAKDSDTVSATLKFEVKKLSQIKVKESQSIAHMGLIYEAPSNSIPAFVKAAESNAFFGIETDLRETKDGQFVLIHDADISSRTTGFGIVSNLTLWQVQQAVMNKGTNINKYNSLRIPTLEEYLEVVKSIIRRQ